MLTSHVNINRFFHLCIVIDCLIFVLVSTSWNWEKEEGKVEKSKMHLLSWVKKSIGRWLMDFDTIHISICHMNSFPLLFLSLISKKLMSEILQIMSITILLSFNERVWRKKVSLVSFYWILSFFLSFLLKSIC